MNLQLILSKASIYTTIFLAALIILLASGSLSYHQIRSLGKTESEVRHSQDVQLSLERLFLTIKEAETGQRGYLITHDSSYLEHYIQAKIDVNHSLDTIRKMFSKESNQFEILTELESVIQSRLETLQSTLSYGEVIHPIPDMVRRSMKKGQREMDLIRVRIDRMVGNEKSLYNERKSKYQTVIEIQPIIYLFIILFAISIFTFSFFKITTDRLHLRNANEKLEKAMNEIRMQNTIFSHAEQSSNAGNFMWRQSTDEIICSDNLLHMLECSPGTISLTAEELLNFIIPEDRPLTVEKVKDMMSTRIFPSGILRLTTCTGNLKYFKVSGMFTREAGHDALIATFLDLTNDFMLNERLNLSHTMLANTEYRHDQMISEVEDYAIILLNSEGFIEKWNKGAEKIKGYTDNEIIGKSFEIFYAQEDIDRQLPLTLLNQARQYGRTAHEGWRVRKDKSKFWGSVVITALHDDHQNVIGFTKVTRDLTQQKQSEENQAAYNRSIERKNAELELINSELASFNHIASHDLQEPLRKIQTFISRIVEEQLDPSTERGKEYFNRIRSSANRMQLLIDDLITYSHTRGDNNLVPTNLDQILRTVLIEMNQRLEDIGAVIQSHPLPTINGIPFQLEQLFTNLIDNALKYRNSEHSTIIKISASIADAAQLPVVLNPSILQYHKITFEDNGIGFDNQYAESIFTLFQRLHGKNEYTGTGIGLAICKRIVENHNGQITAEGIVNKGATFHIFFPA